MKIDLKEESLDSLYKLRDDIDVEISERTKVFSDDWMSAVCYAFGIRADQIYKRTHRRDFAMARQICMTIERCVWKKTLEAIGMKYGRDHATVVYSVKQVFAVCSTDPDFRYSLKKIVAKTSDEDIKHFIETRLLNPTK